MPTAPANAQSHAGKLVAGGAAGFGAVMPGDGDADTLDCGCGTAIGTGASVKAGAGTARGGSGVGSATREDRVTPRSSAGAVAAGLGVGEGLGAGVGVGLGGARLKRSGTTPGKTLSELGGAGMGVAPAGGGTSCACAEIPEKKSSTAIRLMFARSIARLFFTACTVSP